MEHQSVTSAEFDALKDLSEKRWRNWVALVAGSDDTSCMSRLTKLESQIAGLKDAWDTSSTVGLDNSRSVNDILSRLGKLESNAKMLGDRLSTRLHVVERRLEHHDLWLNMDTKALSQPPASYPSYVDFISYPPMPWHGTEEQIADWQKKCDELEKSVAAKQSVAPQPTRRVTPDQLEQLAELDNDWSLVGEPMDANPVPSKEECWSALAQRINAHFLGAEKK